MIEFIGQNEGSDLSSTDCTRILCTFYSDTCCVWERCSPNESNKKLINSSRFHFVGVTSCYTSVKQRWMLMWLAACQVCKEALQTWRMFSNFGLQATTTGEKNGESHSKPLSLIYSLLAVQLDKKEEKRWQDDKRKLQRKTLREYFLS